MKMFPEVTIRSWHDRRFWWFHAIGRPRIADWLVGVLSAAMAWGIWTYIR